MHAAPNIPHNTIRAGKFVSIRDQSTIFFSLITDLSLEVTHPDILLFPPTSNEKLLSSILNKRDMYTAARLRPMLSVTTEKPPGPVKTIPAHFATVHEASQQEIATVFGDNDDPTGDFFWVGTPPDMDAPVCLNLERLTERSNGIFGKTGTGKTFITRLILSGLIHRKKAVNLIFDMHSEYGLQARSEGKGLNFVKGLKTLFPDRVVVCSLDPESTRRRGGNPDVEITLPYNAIRVEDILSLQDELNLHSTAFEAAHLIATRHKKEWLRVLLERGSQSKEFAEEVGAHPESIAALYRKLKRIEQLPFVVPVQPTGYKHSSSIDQIIEYLDQGISVIIEFGNFSSTFVYLLIANVISRRIHYHYVTKTEKFLGSQQPEDEPQKLMICIEEAHKFLNPQTARQTIFGTIAREMRKYYVSLLIIDQRPSGIDLEILSQIGTKIIAQLNDDKDVQAVLSGVNNASGLRAILSSLDSKKQALLLGHALAMPVVVQTREYDEEFYRSVQAVNPEQMASSIQEIFPG